MFVHSTNTNSQESKNQVLIAFVNLEASIVISTDYVHRNKSLLNMQITEGITKYHGQSWLNNRNLFSHSYGSWKPKLRVPAQSGSGEGSVPGWQRPLLIVCSYDFSGVHIHRKKIPPPLLRRPPILSDSGSTLMT